jgi:hypothetical protein
MYTVDWVPPLLAWNQMPSKAPLLNPIVEKVSDTLVHAFLLIDARGTVQVNTGIDIAADFAITNRMFCPPALPPLM